MRTAIESGDANAEVAAHSKGSSSHPMPSAPSRARSTVWASTARARRASSGPSAAPSESTAPSIAPTPVVTPTPAPTPVPPTATPEPVRRLSPTPAAPLDGGPHGDAGATATPTPADPHADPDAEPVAEPLRIRIRRAQPVAERRRG